MFLEIIKSLNILNLEIFSYNEIDNQGLSKLGEGVSKLLNLTFLDLNFQLNFHL